jgi:hypothetical protein
MNLMAIQHHPSFSLGEAGIRAAATAACCFCCSARAAAPSSRNCSRPQILAQPSGEMLSSMIGVTFLEAGVTAAPRRLRTSLPGGIVTVGLTTRQLPNWTNTIICAIFVHVQNRRILCQSTI